MSGPVRHGRRRETLRPGDLYVLPSLPDHPVEWLVVEVAADGARALVVPADTQPLAGSADVEAPASSSAGPLSLRCRFAVWVRSGVLSEGRRTGLIEPERLALVRRRRRELELGPEVGSLIGSALSREVDEESEYRTWIGETILPARDALAALQFARDAPRRPVLSWRSPPRVVAALAALFLVAAVGLSIWVAVLGRELDERSRAAFGAASGVVAFGESTRGPEDLHVASGAPYLVLSVILGADVPDFPRYQLEIASADGPALATGPPFAAERFSEWIVVVPGSLLSAADEVSIRLYGVTADRRELIEERSISLEASPLH